MTQKRFWNWKDDDSTEALSRWMRGIIPYGVIYGFDGDMTTPGMNLTLKHTLSGMEQVNDALTLEQNIGVLLTKQGVMVQEDADIVLPIGTETTGEDRIDLIICEHDYQQVIGGTVAIYSVIQGTPAPSPVAPALTAPNKQVIVGTLYVPAGTTDLTADPDNTIFTKSVIRVFDNDTSIVRTDVAQTITASKKIYHQTGKFGAATMVGTTLTAAVGDPRNFYSLQASSADRVSVTAIDVPTTAIGEANILYIASNQKLRFKIPANGGVFCGPSAEDVYTEPGELIMLINVAVNVPALGYRWMVVAGNTAKGAVNKLRKSLKQAKSATLTDIDGAATTSMIELPQDGNLLDVTNTGVDPLKGIKSFYEADTVTAYTTEGGTILTLFNVSAAAIGVQVNQVVPASFKPIRTFHGADFTWEVGAALTIIEQPTGWWVVGYVSATLNLFQRFLDDNVDVNYTGAPTLDDVLYYDGSNWINKPVESLIDRQRTFTSLQIHGTDTATFSGGILTVPLTGNIFNFTLPTGTGDIVDIKHPAGAACPSGTRLTLRCTGFTGGGFNIGQLDMAAGGFNEYEFDGSTPPVYLLVESVVEVYKATNGKWTVLSAPTNTSSQIQTFYTTLDTDKADRSIDTWHEVGAVGEPAYNVAWQAVVGSGIYFKKNDVGMVTVSFAAEYLNLNATGINVFTLPVGYRPGTPVPMMFPVRDDADGYTGVCVVIDPNGTVTASSGTIGFVQQNHYYRGTFTFQT